MITLRYFAAARAAAGCSEEVINASTLADCLAMASERHGSALERVLAACSFLVDGLAATRRDVALVDGAVVDVLPPFAGG